MDVLRTFVESRRTLVITAGLVIGVSLLLQLILWRNGKAVLEQFQDIAAASETERKNELNHLPPEIANPTTPPMYQQENCATIKKAIDAMKLMGVSKNSKTKEMAQSQILQSQKSELEDKFRALGCKEYLEQIAAGDIPAPQTPPDMRPEAGVLTV